MKFHFFSSIVMTALILFMALNNNAGTRTILILPILLFYQLTFILFQLECDVLYKCQWSAKEKKIRKHVAEQTAQKIVTFYTSNQKQPTL